MNGWSAFRTGLSHALCHRWVLLILFAANLLSALLLAVLPALGLAAEFGHRPAIRQAADGVDAWLVTETLTAPLSGAALVEGGWPELTHRLRQATLLGLLTVAALPLLAWLSATFLSGGVLLTYAEAVRLSVHDEAPQPFCWRRFLWGCRHWFGAFLLLGLMQGVASVVVLIPAAGAAVAAVAAVGGWLTWVVVPLLALVAMFWLVLFEYARVVAVVGETRNVARAFAGAVRFALRQPLSLVGLYGPALLLLGLLHALYHWGLMPHLPLDWWPLMLVVQQAFIMARLWARLVRLAGGVTLYQKAEGRRR